MLWSLLRQQIEQTLRCKFNITESSATWSTKVISKLILGVLDVHVYVHGYTYFWKYMTVFGAVVYSMDKDIIQIPLLGTESRQNVNEHFEWWLLHTLQPPPSWLHWPGKRHLFDSGAHRVSGQEREGGLEQSQCGVWTEIPPSPKMWSPVCRSRMIDFGEWETKPPQWSVCSKRSIKWARYYLTHFTILMTFGGFHRSLTRLHDLDLEIPPLSSIFLVS